MEFLDRLGGLFRRRSPEHFKPPELEAPYGYIAIGPTKTPLRKALAVWAGHYPPEMMSSYFPPVRGVIPSNTVGLIGSGNSPIELTIERPPANYKKPRVVLLEDVYRFQWIGDIAKVVIHSIPRDEVALEHARSRYERVDAELKELGPREPTNYLASLLEEERREAKFDLHGWQNAVKLDRDLQPTAERLQIVGRKDVVLTIRDPHVAVQPLPGFPDERASSQRLEVVGKPPDNPQTLIYTRSFWGRVKILYPEAH